MVGYTSRVMAATLFSTSLCPNFLHFYSTKPAASAPYFPYRLPLLLHAMSALGLSVPPQRLRLLAPVAVAAPSARARGSMFGISDSQSPWQLRSKVQGAGLTPHVIFVKMTRWSFAISRRPAATPPPQIVDANLTQSPYNDPEVYQLYFEGLANTE